MLEMYKETQKGWENNRQIQEIKVKHQKTRRGMGDTQIQEQHKRRRRKETKETRLRWKWRKINRRRQTHIRWWLNTKSNGTKTNIRGTRILRPRRELPRNRIRLGKDSDTDESTGQRNKGVKKILPGGYRGIQFAKEATLLGRGIDLGKTETKQQKID